MREKLAGRIYVIGRYVCCLNFKQAKNQMPNNFLHKPRILSNFSSNTKFPGDELRNADYCDFPPLLYSEFSAKTLTLIFQKNWPCHVFLGFIKWSYIIIEFSLVRCAIWGPRAKSSFSLMTEFKYKKSFLNQNFYLVFRIQLT